MSGLSIKHVRTATGLSQVAFAELIDVAGDTVSSIEQGRIGVSSKVARRIFIETGAIPTFLEMEDSEGRAYAWTRELYTPEHFRTWREITKGDLLTSIRGGTITSRFHAVLECHFAAAKAEDKLGKFQAALALAAFDLAFTMGFSDTARFTAHANRVQEDFDLLATIAGRIEPKKS
jgi:DNA-binding XRE family transcriptional regulator